MSKISIINCHIHTFTGRHVPQDYPYKFLWLFKQVPILVKWMAIVVSWFSRDIGEKLFRLYRFQQETNRKNQSDVLAEVRKQYPQNTRFVVLPMDMANMGHGKVTDTLAAQHDELAALANDPDVGHAVIPFATINPVNDPEARELWRAVDTHGFKGVKIYPKLGFAPDHDTLMTHVYPEMARRGLPLMTHCMRGGVQGKEVSDHRAARYTEPRAYVPVMTQHRDLKVCLAHFGGHQEWDAYVNDGAGSGTPKQRQENWQVGIRDMIGSGEWPGLWTDISYTLFHFEDYIPFLRLFLLDDNIAGERLRRRVLFGSDFYMTRQEKLSERAVCFRLRNALGEDVFRQIAENNPRVWLGEVEEAALV